jgi:hypothetical protein
LHVTRRQDLLELELPEPDMSVYGGGAPAQDQPAQMTLQFPAPANPNLRSSDVITPQTGATHESN